MSKFTFNRAGNLVEIYQGDSLLCAIFADRFPDFVAAASGAMTGPMTPDSKVSDVEARERAEFEAAHTDCNLSRHLHYPSCYADSHVQAAWRGWQRARANQQPSAQWIAVSDLRKWIDENADYGWSGDAVCVSADDLRALLPQSPDTMRKG